MFQGNLLKRPAMSTAAERIIQQKLDELIERTARIEARCVPCGEQVERNRRALYGNGDDGMLATCRINTQQLKSIERLRWWLLGCCGTAAIGVFLLVADKIFRGTL